MSAVRFLFPKRRLSQLLKTPGGLPVAEALRNAQANLSTLGAACIAEIAGVVQAAEALMARCPPTHDDAFADELYGIVSPPIGIASVCGLGGIDVALHSLCDLVDHLKANTRWDVEALQVHVQALKLLLHTESLQDAKQTDAVLSGLRRVSQRYAPSAVEAEAG